jgi:hypothetical protein
LRILIRAHPVQSTSPHANPPEPPIRVASGDDSRALDWNPIERCSVSGESRRAFFANADADTLVVHCRSSGRTYICIHCIHLPTFQPISICISAVQTFPFKRHYASHLVTAQRPTASRKTLRAVVPAIIGYSWTNLGTAYTDFRPPQLGPSLKDTLATTTNHLASIR